MGLLVSAVVAGILGTLTMDVLNLVFARSGLIVKIEVAGIGRMAAGWMRGRFRYGHPSEMVPITREVPCGYLVHHAIGLGLAVPFVLAWALHFGQPPSPGWAFVYGVGTTAASWFLVYPSMGFGMLGLRSPEGVKAALSSLANHLFYGLGLAVGIAVTC